MSKPPTYLVKDAARLSGVSVRALHHYDQIGLLVPSGRTPAGYRVYDKADLLRLQQILIGRALGLSLEEIRQSLEAPDFDHIAALRRQRAALQARATETETMLRAVDAALAQLTGKDANVEMSEMFQGFDPAQYEAEAQTRWGGSPAYQESARRTARYGEADWRAMRAEVDAIWTDAARLRAQGAAADSPAAREILERHRGHVERWFYPCPPALHAKLVELWEADPRFSEGIDRFGEGLTAWLAAANRAAS